MMMIIMKEMVILVDDAFAEGWDVVLMVSGVMVLALMACCLGDCVCDGECGELGRTVNRSKNRIVVGEAGVRTKRKAGSVSGEAGVAL